MPNTRQKSHSFHLDPLERLKRADAKRTINSEREAAIYQLKNSRLNLPARSTRNSPLFFFGHVRQCTKASPRDGEIPCAAEISGRARRMVIEITWTSVSFSRTSGRTDVARRGISLDCGNSTKSKLPRFPQERVLGVFVLHVWFSIVPRISVLVSFHPRSIRLGILIYI